MATKWRSIALWRQWRKRRKKLRQHRRRIVPTVEAILELLGVGAEIFRRHRHVRSGDAALQVTPEPLDCVHGRSLKADIFMRAVIYGFVLIPGKVKAAIAVQFVGMQFATGLHVGSDEGL